MRIYLSILSLVLFAGMPAAAQDSAAAPLEVVEIKEDPQAAAYRQVEQYFTLVTNLQAGFIQKNYDGSLVRGTMSLARPGRVRFDYGVDATMLIVSDGEVLNLVDYEIGKVKRWPVNDTPLQVLLGSAVDLASAGATILPAPGGQDDVIALIASNPKKPDQGEVTLYFHRDDTAPAGLRLDSWVVLDAKHQETRVTLVNHMVNGLLDDALWQYEDPRGVAKRRRIRR